VLHFVYLMSSDPAGYTADHFRDVEKLELDSHFRDYMSQAFAPLGVYLSFWQPEIAPGKRTFRVMLVNDEYREASGTLTIALAGKEARKPFTVGALGQTTLYIDLDVPNTPGDFQLQAKADAGKGQPTISRRNVVIKAPAAK
jgi:beta-galactosidase